MTTFAHGTPPPTCNPIATSTATISNSETPTGTQFPSVPRLVTGNPYSYLSCEIFVVIRLLLICTNNIPQQRKHGLLLRPLDTEADPQTHMQMLYRPGAQLLRVFCE